MRISFSVFAVPTAMVFLGLWTAAPSYASLLNCDQPGFVLGCYGLQIAGTVNTDLPATTGGGGGSYFDSQVVGSPVLLDQTSYALPPISHGDSVTAFDPIANGIYTASASSNVYFASIVDGSLHVSVGTSGGTADPYQTDNADAIAYLAWYDTLYVSGLPPGTPVTLLLTDSIDGGIQLSGDTTGSQVNQAVGLSNPVSTGACSEAVLQNAFTAGTVINSTQDFDLCTVSGATLTLVDYIAADLYGGVQWSANANLNDTAVAYVDSLTPGAIVTSASGINYATPSSTVPEPSFVIPMALGLLFLTTRHRLRPRKV